MVELARYRSDPRGGYFVHARYNEKGLWKIVEHLPSAEMARLYAIQLQSDDQFRHVQLREVRDWDFVRDEIKQPKRKLQREASEKKARPAPVRFSFLED